MNLELLSELCETPGASGREERMREVVRRELEPLADEVEVDPLGNLVARRPGGGGPRLMLSAHMDEIGFMVTHVEDAGFLRLITLGGFDPKTLTAQRVVVHGREDLLGVLGVQGRAPDDRRGEAPRARSSRTTSWTWGCPAERVRELVRPGDVVTRERALARLGDLVTCKSLDNRAGLYVMIEALRALGEHDCEVVAVASVQEEVGLRGARVATSRVRPDIGLAIDITLANDGRRRQAPRAHHRASAAGAAVKVYDAGDDRPAARWWTTWSRWARSARIPHQLEVMARGSTDTRELALSRRRRAGRLRLDPHPVRPPGRRDLPPGRPRRLRRPCRRPSARRPRPWWSPASAEGEGVGARARRELDAHAPVGRAGAAPAAGRGGGRSRPAGLPAPRRAPASPAVGARPSSSTRPTRRPPAPSSTR